MRATILTLTLVLAASMAAGAADNETATAATNEQPTALEQAPGAAQRPAPPPPASVERRRRGSMVGYIADATIESQVRIRFDAAFHNNVPDRSEFFYAQCGCNFAGAPGPGAPGAGDLVTDLQFQQVAIDAQYAVNNRFGVFASLPLRFVQPQTFLGQILHPPLKNTFVDESGLGDIRAGVKVAMVSNDDTTLTAQVQGYFQTGDAKKGLGTNHASIEPALLLYQRVANRVAIESQFGDWHPFDGSSIGTLSYAGDVLFYGVGPSVEVVKTANVTFAPVVELVGWHVLGGQQQVAGTLRAADGTNIVNLKFGARTTFGNGNSFYVGYGKALTDAVWYTDIVRVEYRYSF
jgi:hypothetical protein